MNPQHDVPRKLGLAHLCSSTSSDGSPCRAYAVSGDTLCRWHSQKHQRELENLKDGPIEATPLRKLVGIDTTSNIGLQKFRRGLLANVASGKVDPQTAKGMHDLAVAIYASAQRVDESTSIASIAAAMKAALADTPEGGGGENTQASVK